MTTERYGRCVTCGVRYHYYMSGWPSPDSHTDSSYCPGCKRVADDALKRVRPRFECQYVPVQELDQFKDVTLDKVLRWEEENLQRTKKAGRIPITRIWAPLFNLETGDSQSVREVRHKGISYRVSTWSKSDEHTIEVPMEFDLIHKRLTGNLWR